MALSLLIPTTTRWKSFYPILQVIKIRDSVLYISIDADSAAEKEPSLHIVPLQLLTYHVALVNGSDVGKPRYLANLVTVD